MIRTILLLTPVYVALFWSIALTTNKKKEHTPQLVLSKFMFMSFVGLSSLYLFLTPVPTLYPYFDCALQFVIGLIFPIFYIYFRLLTVDKKLSFRTHGRYLIVPVLLASIYCVAVLLTPWEEFKTWLFVGNEFSNSPNIQFLSIIRDIIRIQFLIQLFLVIIGNQILIKKYGVKVEQFYSDMEEENYSNAKLMNYCMALISIITLLAFALWFELSLPINTLLYAFLSISSFMLYMIGYFGIKQKPINPTFDVTPIKEVMNPLDVIPADSRKKILNKMLVQFEEEKIYLNSQLNIMDIVQAVGTNRTYISSIINQLYNQNFCTFVNSYRIEELKRIYLENPDYINEVLADSCGFGSLNSLKRAIMVKTGMTLPEWKKHTMNSQK